MECFLVAPGPSLDDVDLSLLEGHDVIAINSAFRKVPFAKICYFCDRDWFDQNRGELLLHNGKKIRGTLQGEEMMLPWIEEYTFIRPRGLVMEPKRLAHGFNSGAAAINLAVQLGYTTIYLIGYDMHNRSGRQHFNGDEPVRKTADKTYIDEFIPGFEAMIQPLKDLGIEVVNLTPGSALSAFAGGSLPVRAISQPLRHLRRE